MENGRAGNAGKQAEERAGAGGAFPEHTEQERGEERGIHKSKDELDDVHGVVIHRGEIRRAHAQYDADHGDDLARQEIMMVTLALRKVGLIKVVGKNGVKRGYVARHAGHEGRQQRGQREAKQTGRTVSFHERKDDAVVIIFRDAVIKTLLDLIVGQFVGGIGGNQRSDFVRRNFYRGVFFAERFADGFHGGNGIGRGRIFHGGHGLIVNRLRDNRQREAVVLIRSRGQRDGDHAGNDDEEREKHFRNGGDERSVAGGGHVLRRHRALDDEEVRAPVTE